MKGLRLFVLIVPMVLFIGAALASLVNPDGFEALAKAMSDWILVHFSDAIMWAVFGFVLTCLVVVVSPLGGVKIGGREAKPILSIWNWFAITLCTTIAIGILFWAMAEPIVHSFIPGGEGRGIIPGSEAAGEFALVSLFMHWAVSPYAIYTVAGLAFALSYHNLGKAYSVSGPFSALIGRTVPKPVGSVLDASILFALVLGMAASLGAGMLLLSGGLGALSGYQNSAFWLAFVALAIGGMVLISSLSGLMKGIRILSDWNVRFFFAFVAFIFVFGPTLSILTDGASAVFAYVRDFIPRSLFLGDAANDKAWGFDWTIVYFANWLAWAPVTAIFLGRISRGYTVRAYVMVNLVLPSLFAIVWMSVFGVFALETEAASPGLLSQYVANEQFEYVIFAALQTLPLTEIMVPLLLGLAFISYVTAADSNTEAIAQICQDDRALKAGDETGTPPKGFGPALKILWVVLLATLAWTMVASSGVDGVRMLSYVGGLPALFIVVGLQLALIRMMFSAKVVGDPAGQGIPPQSVLT